MKNKYLFEPFPSLFIDVRRKDSEGATKSRMKTLVNKAGDTALLL